MRRGNLAARLDRLEAGLGDADQPTPPTPTGDVHPVAALFPMLPDDELQELADDIAANGLREPIVLDGAGTLIDGRNRLAGCALAGVSPDFATLNGEDAIRYILSLNLARRHLTKGQRALLVARSQRHEETLHASTIVDTAARFQLSRDLLFDANVIVDFAPELADRVIAGTLPFARALDDAQEARALQERRDAGAERAERELDRLRRLAADLAELVEANQLPLSEAVAAWQERERIERERRQRNVAYFEQATTMLWSLLREDPARVAAEWVDGLLRTMTVEDMAQLQTGEGLRALASRLTTLAEAVDRRGGLT